MASRSCLMFFFISFILFASVTGTKIQNINIVDVGSSRLALRQQIPSVIKLLEDDGIYLSSIISFYGQENFVDIIENSIGFQLSKTNVMVILDSHPEEFQFVIKELRRRNIFKAVFVLDPENIKLVLQQMIKSAE